MKLHTVTLQLKSLMVRTLHRTKSYIGNPFQDIGNPLRLLPRSMNVLTNQHESFQHTCSHSHVFLETSQKVTHLIIAISQTRLIVEFLSDELLKN